MLWRDMLHRYLPPGLALGALLLGWRDFTSREEIAQHIVHSVNFDPQMETPSDADTFFFFQTSKQRTWLVATPELHPRRRANARASYQLVHASIENRHRR